MGWCTKLNEKEYKLRQLVNMLSSIRGRHTELVSFYIAAGSDLPSKMRQIAQEASTASNIKSKTVRKNVVNALEKILQELKKYKKVPENGLVVFCGNTSKEEGNPKYEIWAIEPPEPLKVSLYRCDQTFVLDPLKEMLEHKKTYGLIVLDVRNADIGILKGKSILSLKELESLVPGKFRKGGQSAVRFQREREGLKRDFLKKVADMARSIFSQFDISGIIVGGPGPVKEEFVNYLPTDLKKKVIAIKDTGYTGEYGLQELVERSEDVLREEEIMREKDLVKEFLSKIAKGDPDVVYGEKQVKQALSEGMVGKLLISEGLQKEKVEEFVELAKKFDTKVELISRDTREGEQFYEMGGIAGYLRF